MNIEQQKRFVGSRLKDIRESRNMSLREVAKLVPISYAQLSRIERGKSFPGLNDPYYLAKAYHVSRLDMLNTIGMSPGVDLKSAQYHNVPTKPIPVINASTSNAKQDMETTKRFFPIRQNAIPKGSFFVVSEDSSKDGIRPGTYVLINPHYVWINRDLYAVWLNGHILVGQVFKSIRFRDGDPHRRTGMLLSNGKGYFSTDYPRTEWKVLGHVDWTVNVNRQDFTKGIK